MANNFLRVRPTRQAAEEVKTNPNDDLGFGTQINKATGRFINRDGSYNIIRKGLSRGKDIHPYQWLVLMPWKRFIPIVFVAYSIVNAIFAGAYMLIGVNHIAGSTGGSAMYEFSQAFFFSAQTLTTVGYGGLHPTGFWCSAVSSMEALIGLMMFALVTGLLFARFSKPSAKIMFSNNILISPYREGRAVVARIVNSRRNILLDLSAMLTMTWIEEGPEGPVRRFNNLPLERRTVAMLPLNWTIVHPIDEDSPLFTWASEDIKKKSVEFLISVAGYDDTFAQTVRANTSYKGDELVFGAKFSPMFQIDQDGHIVLEIHKLHDYTETTV